MRHKVIIIGTGFGGIAVARELLEAGIEDFTLLEKADNLGGTWRDNTYPGAECDVPSALYSYSWAPNPTWEFKWAKQKQIHSYIRSTAQGLGLMPRIRFSQSVESCHWTNGEWVVETDSDTFRAQHVVSAVGQLHIPNIPDFAGLHDYGGESFHTARWNHGVDLRGKRVAVIGNAATAVQVIPAIAPKVRQLTVYGRTPNWIVKKPDRAYTRAEKWLGRRLPWLAKLYRGSLWSLGEFVIWPTIRGNRVTSAALRAQNWWLKRRAIFNPELRKKLTPNYPLGAKRILFSSDYYPALARENVELVTDRIETFTEQGIRAGGEERPHDVVVFATGFQTNPFLKNIDVTGQDGQHLRDQWSDGAHAYLGVSTAGFPNFHMIYGPNTNTGHTSIIFKLEAQARYVAQLVTLAGEGALAVDEGVEANFNAEVQERLRDLAFSRVDASWYKDGDRITNNWMGGSLEYHRRLRTVDPASYRRVA